MNTKFIKCTDELPPLDTVVILVVGESSEGITDVTFGGRFKFDEIGISWCLCEPVWNVSEQDWRDCDIELAKDLNPIKWQYLPKP